MSYVLVVVNMFGDNFEKVCYYFFEFIVSYDNICEDLKDEYKIMVDN